MSDDDTKKRGPGRPRKQTVKTQIKRNGIADEPSNKSNAEENVKDPRMEFTMELLYDNPMMFKKVFNFYKAMAVQDLLMKFCPTHVEIYTIDHKKKSRIYTKFFGNRLHRYYCKEEFEIGLKPSNFLKIFNMVNKDYDTVRIYNNAIDQGDKLNVQYHDVVDDSWPTFQSTLSRKKPELCKGILEDIALEEEYPIRFEMMFKQFKKKIVNANSLLTSISIQKDGKRPLMFTGPYEGKDGKYIDPFPNSQKIKLKSTVPEDEFFVATVSLNYIKPLAGSLVSDYITIAAHESKCLIFTIMLDEEMAGKVPKPGTEVCQIKILTETNTS